MSRKLLCVLLIALSGWGFATQGPPDPAHGVAYRNGHWFDGTVLSSTNA